MSALESALSINDLRTIAKQRLPPAFYHYIEGGADDERAVRGNTEALERSSLIPNFLQDVSSINTTTQVMGQEVSWPVMLAPTGMNRLFHHEGELAVARAAQASQTFYSLSTMATHSIEEVAATSSGAKCFQVYVMKDRGITRDMNQRCKIAGYDSICLTIDVPVAGNREREIRHGLTIPPRMTLANLLGFVRRPNWCWHYLTQSQIRLANIPKHVSDGDSDLSSVIKCISNLFDPSLTWDDVAWIAQEWNGPFAIKGVLSSADAIQARSIGATTVMVSNHGGRQLGASVAPFDVLPQIVDAVGNECEVIMDGGIRRGTHAIKALARGATACMIGRPYLYGLAAGGEQGVLRALEILKTEFTRDMALLGCSSVAEIDERHMHLQSSNEALFR